MSTKMQDLLSRARGELRHQPIEQRVRARIGGEAVVDSRRAILVWEPRRVVPSYAVPAEDIGVELTAAPAENDEVAGVLHPGIPFRVHTAAGSPVSIGDRSGAGFRLDDEDLDGYVELDFSAFDEWYEEDERIEGHPRDPYHRVDVRRSAREARIEVDGEVIAKTTRARRLYETSLPLRFYVPREDVRASLAPSDRTTFGPHKGRASWWSIDAGGRRREALGWSYEEPLPDDPPVAGLVASGTSRSMSLWTALCGRGRAARSLPHWPTSSRSSVGWVRAPPVRHTPRTSTAAGWGSGCACVAGGPWRVCVEQRRKRARRSRLATWGRCPPPRRQGPTLRSDAPSQPTR